MPAQTQICAKCFYRSNQSKCANSKSKNWGKVTIFENSCKEFKEKKTGMG